MTYEVRFKPGAVKDLERLSTRAQSRILEKIETMLKDLRGDVKHLTNFTPEYRMRVGAYRVLFEVDGKTIIVYRIRHRREAYR